MKNFKGKAIYNPSSKAGEYSYWACNFYNGCSARCDYCYNRKGITAKVLGGDEPTLKKCFKNETDAIVIFEKELKQNIDSLREYGLFFNFVSDPCLFQTYMLNVAAWQVCLSHGVPIKILTKQTGWVNSFIDSGNFKNAKIAIGFTLTGHDELEPGASHNINRIQAMDQLHEAGYITWSSIEPIIDLHSSYLMVKQVIRSCNLLKIGLQSGKKYEKDDLNSFAANVGNLVVCNNPSVKVYFKDSFLTACGISRHRLPSWCVDRDYNIFKP